MKEKKRFLNKHKNTRLLFRPTSSDFALSWSILQLACFERIGATKQLLSCTVLNSRRVHASVLVSARSCSNAGARSWSIFLLDPFPGFGASLIYSNPLISTKNYGRSTAVLRRELARNFFYYWIFLGFRSSLSLGGGGLGIRNTLLFEGVASADYAQLSETAHTLTLRDRYWVGSFLPFLPTSMSPVFRSFYNTVYPFFFATCLNDVYVRAATLSTILSWVQVILRIGSADSFLEVNYSFFPTKTELSSFRRLTPRLVGVKRDSLTYTGKLELSRISAYRQLFGDVLTEFAFFDASLEADFVEDFDHVEDYGGGFELNDPTTTPLLSPRKTLSILSGWSIFSIGKFKQPVGLRLVINFLELEVQRYLHFFNTLGLLRNKPGFTAGYLLKISNPRAGLLNFFNYNNIVKPKSLTLFLVLQVFTSQVFLNYFYIMRAWVPTPTCSFFFNYLWFSQGRLRPYLFTIKVYIVLYFYSTCAILSNFFCFFFKLCGSVQYIRASLGLCWLPRTPPYLHPRRNALRVSLIVTVGFIAAILVWSISGPLFSWIGLITLLLFLDLIFYWGYTFFYTSGFSKNRDAATIFKLMSRNSLPSYLYLKFLGAHTLGAFVGWQLYWRLVYIFKKFSNSGISWGVIFYHVNLNAQWVGARAYYFPWRLFFTYNLVARLAAATNLSLEFDSKSLLSVKLATALSPVTFFWLYFSVLLHGFGVFGWWVLASEQTHSNAYLRSVYLSKLMQNNTLLSYYVSVSPRIFNIFLSGWLFFSEMFVVRGWFKIGEWRELLTPWIFFRSSTPVLSTTQLNRYFLDLSGENFLARIFLLDSIPIISDSSVQKKFWCRRTWSRVGCTTQQFSFFFWIFLRAGRGITTIVLALVRAFLIGFLGVCFLLFLFVFLFLLIKPAPLFLTYVFTKFFLLYFFCFTAVWSGFRKK